MVLPAPVGPTIAMVSPASATRSSSSISGRSGSYRNETSSKATAPFARPSTCGATGSGISSLSSSSSNTRSAEAAADCRTLMMLAVWMSGNVNWREYWMNATTSPSDIWPLTTRRPPMTAIAT